MEFGEPALLLNKAGVRFRPEMNPAGFKGPGQILERFRCGDTAELLPALFFQNGTSPFPSLNPGPERRSVPLIRLIPIVSKPRRRIDAVVSVKLFESFPVTVARL
jgi:hypothetical protein